MCLFFDCPKLPELPKSRIISLIPPSAPYRVALDPGHFGGELAVLEDRVIAEPDQGINVREGNLAFHTAKIVQNWLEKKGVKVFLTREKPGRGAISVSYSDWLKSDKQIQNSIKTLEHKSIVPANWKKLIKDARNGKPLAIKLAFQKIYLRHDLYRRAELINEWRPHLTFIMHFNSEGQLKEKFEANNVNYNMAFVPGAIDAKSVQGKHNQKRFDFLANSPVIDESIKLCRSFLTHLVKETGVRPKVLWDQFPKSWKRTTYHGKWWGQFFQSRATGIYGRNLVLTRNVDSPLCYGESLFMDHKQEAINLSEFNGIPPKRIISVARAYAKAALDYLGISYRPNEFH